jgi:carboxyl-terminal processing protease
MRIRSPALFSSLMILTGVSAAAVADAPKTLSPKQRAANLESFELVWKTIRDKYYDPTVRGLDWKAIHEQYRPRLEKATSMAEARQVLREMIGRLGQSHFNIVSSDVYQEITRNGRSVSANDGTVGLEVRVIGGHALVTQVTEGLPAAKRGVKPGWEILRIDGQALAAGLGKIAASYKKSSLLQLHLSRAVTRKLQGAPGAKTTVVFLDGQNHETTLSVPFAEPKGTRFKLGYLPAFYTYLETHQEKPNIVYIALNAFFDPMNIMKAFAKAVTSDLKADGVVLDLRGNPGGIGGMAMGIGSWFISRPDQKLGTMKLRSGTIHFILNPRLETFDGPLAILVDGCSASTSEILAGGLQDLKRARIFGTRTAGAALPSVFERLPNGDGFQYAIADYISTGGKRLEGEGVHPDVEVQPSRQALLAGHDPPLEAALEWIRSQKKPR